MLQICKYFSQNWVWPFQTASGRHWKQMFIGKVQSLENRFTTVLPNKSQSQVYTSLSGDFHTLIDLRRCASVPSDDVGDQFRSGHAKLDDLESSDVGFVEISGKSAEPTEDCSSSSSRNCPYFLSGQHIYAKLHCQL